MDNIEKIKELMLSAESSLTEAYILATKTSHNSAEEISDAIDCVKAAEIWLTSLTVAQIIAAKTSHNSAEECIRAAEVWLKSSDEGNKSLDTP